MSTCKTSGVVQWFILNLLQLKAIMLISFGKSSNGRTQDSGSWSRGSTPLFPTIHSRPFDFMVLAVILKIILFKNNCIT